MGDGWRTFLGVAAVISSYYLGKEEGYKKLTKENEERARDNEIARLKAQIASLERKIK